MMESNPISWSLLRDWTLFRGLWFLTRIQLVSQFTTIHFTQGMQWNVSGSKLCEVPTPPPESERRVQVSIIAFVGERYYLLVNVGLSKYLGCIALHCIEVVAPEDPLELE